MVFFNPATIPGVASVGKDNEFPSPLTPHTFDQVWSKLLVTGGARRTETRYARLNGELVLALIFWFLDGGYLIAQIDGSTYRPFWIGCEHKLSMKKGGPFLRHFRCERCGYTLSQDSS